MEIKVLSNFITVAQVGSITAAAKLLHISQPALSNQLHSLEEEVGHKLLDRGKRHISLTDTGRYLFDKAQAIVNMANTTMSEMSSLGSQLKGRLNIGTTEYFGTSLLNDVLCKYHNDFPEVRINFRTVDRVEAIDMLDKHELDLTIVIGTVNTTKYHFFKMPAVVNMGILINSQSPFATTRSITPAILKKIPIIVPRQFADQAISKSWYNDTIDKLNIIGTFNQTVSIVSIVESNICAAVVPESIANIFNNDQLLFKPFDPPFFIDIFAIWNKDSNIPTTLKYFFDYLESSIRKNWMEPIFALSD